MTCAGSSKEDHDAGTGASHRPGVIGRVSWIERTRGTAGVDWVNWLRPSESLFLSQTLSAVSGGPRPAYPASSISSFFFSASSFVILKLRIWPAFGTSRFGPESPPEAALPRRKHRHPSTCWPASKTSADTSTEGTDRCSCFRSSGARAEVGVHAFAQFHRDPVALHVDTRPVTTSPSLCSAMYSSSAVGCSCFSPSRRRRFSRSFSSTMRPHHLANFQHVLRMIDPLLVHDVADVNHAFDVFGHLHKRAELLELRDRAFHDRPDRIFLLDLVPGIAQRLLQPQRDALVRRIDAQNHNLHRCRPASPRRKASAPSSTRTSRTDESARQAPAPVPQTHRNRSRAQPYPARGRRHDTCPRQSSTGSGCNCLRPSEIRFLPASTFRILTSSCCPTVSTSAGLFTRPCEISATCSMPSTPPMSIKAP